jgi:hypothetical protein
MLLRLINRVKIKEKKNHYIPRESVKGHFEAYTAECFVFVFFSRTNEYGKKQNKYLNV